MTRLTRLTRTASRWASIALCGVLCSGIGLCQTSCSATPPHAATPRVGPLLAPAEVAGQWMAHQRIRAQLAGAPEAHTFEAVVQKDAERLTLVGLGPMRTRLFTLVQVSADPAALELELASPEHPLPFPPALMVRDVQRVFFVALPGAPLGDGEHEGEAQDGTRLEETWQGGRLLERRFADAAVVRFAQPGWGAGEGPPVIELSDVEHGYVLTLETLSWSVLETETETETEAESP